jgi:hypothetical protein
VSKNRVFGPNSLPDFWTRQYSLIMPILTGFGANWRGPKNGQVELVDLDALGQEQEAQGHGTPLYIGPDGVRQIQETLKKADHDPGSVDGIWGEGTEKALREFQEANELAPTGNLNIKTIYALDLGSLLQGEAGQSTETESKMESEPKESESSETQGK